MLDTLVVVAQSSDGHFYFSFSPTHAGPNTFSYKFTQPGSEQDSLTVDNLSSSHRFFVKSLSATR